MIHAPARLPFAPRPISTELLSSWLLRVAAANLISLRELLDGLQSRYGPVLTNASIDYGIPEAAVMALSRFCRVEAKAIRMLGLRQRVPSLTPGMFLGFTGAGLLCAKYSSERVGYGFCPLCLAGQQTIHVPWEWSLSCLSRCTIHRRPLLEGCPACGETDPLTFAGPNSSRSTLCRLCGGYLDASVDGTADNNREGDLQAVEDDYRAALDGAVPVLLPKTTPSAFRLFFEEILHLLARRLNCCSRRDTVEMIAMLVLKAAPNRNQSARRGVRLWATLLSVIPDYDGDMIERTSIRWPVELRRRFQSGLRHRTRKRWPYTPYRPTESSRAVQRVELASTYGLMPS